MLNKNGIKIYFYADKYFKIKLYQSLTKCFYETLVLLKSDQFCLEMKP